MGLWEGVLSTVPGAHQVLQSGSHPVCSLGLPFAQFWAQIWLSVMVVTSAVFYPEVWAS